MIFLTFFSLIDISALLRQTDDISSIFSLIDISALLRQTDGISSIFSLIDISALLRQTECISDIFIRLSTFWLCCVRRRVFLTDNEMSQLRYRLVVITLR